ncbi:hypothetical protein [Sorangium sp. So ce1000]
MIGGVAIPHKLGVAIPHKLGVAILRTAWFNLDGVWAVALIGAGVVAVLL